MLIPFDHDDDEYSGDQYSTRRRRGRPLRLTAVALVLFGAWLMLPPPVSDASPRVAAIPRDSVIVVAEPVTLISVPFVASDTIFADTAFLSDSAIIAAAAQIEAEAKAAAAAARQAAADAAAKAKADAARPRASQTSATDAATEQLTQERLAGVLSRSMPPIDSILVGLRGGSRGPAPH